MERYKHDIVEFVKRNYTTGRNHVRVYVDYYYSNGPLEAFVSRHPTVYTLFLATVCSFALILITYFSLFLLWALYYASTVFSILMTMLGYCIKWLLFALDHFSHLVFKFAFPAFCATTLASLVTMFLRVRRDILKELDLSNLTLMILKVLLGIASGQVLLFALPRSLRVIAPTFLSNPVLILMLFAVMLSLFYGVYRFLVTFGVEAAADNTCAVCLVNPKAILVRPCKHYALCIDCAPLLNDCPVCKTHIEHYERVYTT